MTHDFYLIGLAHYKVDKRYADVSEFEFIMAEDKSQMQVSICVAGWIKEKEDFVNLWKGFEPVALDKYCIQYEPEAFARLGRGLEEMVAKALVGTAAVKVVETTTLAALTWPIAVLKAGNAIDNRTLVCRIVIFSLVCLPKHCPQGWADSRRCPAEQSPRRTPSTIASSF